MQMAVNAFRLYTPFVPSRAQESEKNRFRLACGTCDQQYARPLYFIAVTAGQLL